MTDEQEKVPRKVTDIDAVAHNAEAAVKEFSARWMSMPSFDMGVEVMDQRQLRDAMGLRATIDAGDPWPAAEKCLIAAGFRWQNLGSTRVMFLRERDGYTPDTGWEEAEEVE